MVFHRILDFKTRLDFYPASYFITPRPRLGVFNYFCRLNIEGNGRYFDHRRRKGNPKNIN